MYFNIFLSKDNTYYKNYAFIDLNRNIDLYDLKRDITTIENTFNSEYGDSNKYYLSVSNKDYDA